MNSLEYDIDSTGGSLMPQILALTAPPGIKEKSFQDQGIYGAVNEIGLAAHPYFRRPGRGHNHDCCDACTEGGDLICCDVCPASFHLTCHDPPLDEDELPTGEWACHRCRMSAKEEENCSEEKPLKSYKGVKRKAGKDPNGEEKEKVCAGGREFPISDTPLSTLIKAAAAINPTQFKLPYEMTLPVPFYGESKDLIKKNGARRFPRKKPYELDNGLVPLPAKLCFLCNKSCRTGPLIPCDFCPLFFHLDCLDPPLTIPPMDRWMCPNHPEHIVDTTLLTSHSLTERVKLWDHFTVPLDQDAVKLQFFQRCHRLNPPFRFKVKKALRSRIRVPTAIKAHYKHPPELLPHLSPSQYLPLPPPYDSYSEQSSAGDRSPPDGNLCIKEEPSLLRPSKEERDQWLASLLSLQSSIIKHMVINNSFVPTEGKTRESSPDQRVNGYILEDLDESVPPLPNGDITSPETKDESNRLCIDGTGNGQHRAPSHASKKSAYKATKSRHYSTVSSLKSRRAKVPPSTIVSDTLRNLESVLRNRLESSKSSTNLSNLDQTVIELLAYERLKQIVCPDKDEVILSTPPLLARALLCPLLPDIRLKDLVPAGKNYSSDPVPMSYRILNIGKGAQNHVNLNLYGVCNYISCHHASIIFDEMTGHYELLNYSEYCTKVDGVRYNCNFDGKTVSQAVPPPILQQIRDIISKRRCAPPFDKEPQPPPAMTSRPKEDFVRCSCRDRIRTFSGFGSTYEDDEDGYDEGWEGAAVLHHGSCIRFGCLKFVFSVVEEAKKGDWARDAEIIYARFLKAAEVERKRDEEEQHEESRPRERRRDDDEQHEGNRLRDRKYRKEEPSYKS